MATKKTDDFVLENVIFCLFVSVCVCETGAKNWWKRYSGDGVTGGGKGRGRGDGGDKKHEIPSVVIHGDPFHTTEAEMIICYPLSKLVSIVLHLY